MKKLGTLVAATDDRVLATVLEHSSVDDLALLLRLVPMARMNPLIQFVPLDRLRDAFDKLRGNSRSHEGVTDQAIASVVTLLSTQFAEREGPVVEDLVAVKDDANSIDRPVCVRALDFAGKILSGSDE